MAKARKQHPETDTLRRGIDRCLAHVTAFSGTMCRAVATKYANSSDLLTGDGAKIHGGRWNPPGLFCAVYGTLDPHAALAETVGTYGSYAIPYEQRLPLVLVAIDVKLQRVLDLTDGKTRQHLGVSEERMLEAYRQGQDLHEKTASLILGKSIVDVTDEERRLAKAVNFGLLFGQSAKGLVEYAANTYDVYLSEKEAHQFRDACPALRPRRQVPQPVCKPLHLRSVAD